MQKFDCILALEATGSLLTRLNIENLAELSKKKQSFDPTKFGSSGCFGFFLSESFDNTNSCDVPSHHQIIRGFFIENLQRLRDYYKTAPPLLIFNPHKGTEMNTWDGNQLEGSRECDGRRRVEAEWKAWKNDGEMK